jgi:hypothetical protein
VLAVLVVGESAQFDAAPEPGSSLEVLHARDAEEAVEKLGRNRRIDAVLILSPAQASATVAAIREDILAPPPIFLPAGAPAISGTRALAAEDPAGLLARVAQALEG